MTSARNFTLAELAIVAAAEAWRDSPEVLATGIGTIPRVAVGRSATVIVQASNEQVPGKVTAIAPSSTIVGGDVVYTVTIDLDQQPDDLRWGMTVDVEISGE